MWEYTTTKYFHFESMTLGDLLGTTLENSPYMWGEYGFFLQETINSTYLGSHIASNLWTYNKQHIQVIHNVSELWICVIHIIPPYIIIHHNKSFYICISFPGFQESSLLTKYPRRSMTSKRKSIHNYKLVEPHLNVLRGLGAHIVLENRDEFKKSYGNLLGILNIKVSTTVMHTLVKIYDHPLWCFNF